MLQPGDRVVRGPNGERGIYRNGQIITIDEPAPTPGPVAVPAMQQVIAPRPDMPNARHPEQARADALDVEGKEYDVTAKPVFDRARAIAQVRGDVRGDKRILTYESALPIWASALDSPNTPEADALLVNAIAKIGDPATGVQQREGDAYEAAAPSYERIKAQLMKEFGSDGAGNFSVEGRQRIKEAMTNRMRAVADSYRAARAEHAAYIKSLGLPEADIDAIIGPNMGATFQAQEERYLGRKPSLAKDRQPPEKPRLPGDIGFNVEADIRGDAMKPEQAAAYNAWWKSNPDPTADQLRAFGESIGVPILNADKIIEAKRKGHGVAPGETTVFQPPDISDVRKGDEVVDPLLRGAADVLTLGLSDEIAGVVDSVTKGGTVADNIARERAIRDFDNEKNFYPKLAGQLGGSLVLPTFGANNVRSLAGVGAGYGAGYGFGSSDGGIANRSVNALMGSAAGGATGGAAGALPQLLTRGAQAIGRRIAGPPDARQNALLAASDVEGVPINMADLYPGARNTVATLETMPGASGIIEEGVEAGRNALQGRVQTLARGGTAREDMGQVIQDAGRRTVGRMDNQADRLYTRARRGAEGVDVIPQSTVQTLAGLVRQEAQVPGGTRAGAVIREYAEAFEGGGPITIDGARAMRSELSARLRDDGGLSKQQATRITNQIMRSVNDDIERSLTTAGRARAVADYRAADRFYAQSREEIEQTIEKFIGTDTNPKSAEQTLSLMQNASGPKGDARNMVRMLGRLSPDERRDYAATLVEPLGRMSPDEPFSPAKFIQNVRKLSPAARRAVFGAEGARSIQNLVRLSNAKKETVGRLNNSRSGQVSNYRTVISSLFFGVPGGGALLGAAAGLNMTTGAAGGAAIAGAGIGISRQMARALMNEDFTRLIANAPATVNPRVINNHVGRLRQLATKDPSLRSVVESLEQQLLKAANDNAGRVTSAAAEDEE